MVTTRFRKPAPSEQAMLNRVEVTLLGSRSMRSAPKALVDVFTMIAAHRSRNRPRSYARLPKLHATAGGFGFAQQAIVAIVRTCQNFLPPHLWTTLSLSLPRVAWTRKVSRLWDDWN